MKFEESETKKNLEKALQGEALAHLKYQFYRSKIANLSKELEQNFDEIVKNEKEHGKIWFKLLNNNKIPTDIINLKDSIAGETYEFTEMYPKFAKIAEKEGFYEIADLFNQVAEIEQKHSEKFKKMLKKVENNTIFQEKTQKTWKCLNCGHTYIGKTPPQTCPTCKHPQKYFTNKKCD